MLVESATGSVSYSRDMGSIPTTTTITSRCSLEAPYAAHIVSRRDLNLKPHGTSFSWHLPIEMPPRGHIDAHLMNEGFQHYTTYINIYVKHNVKTFIILAFSIGYEFV